MDGLPSLMTSRMVSPSENMSIILSLFIWICASLSSSKLFFFSLRELSKGVFADYLPLSYSWEASGLNNFFELSTDEGKLSRPAIF